MMAIHCKYGGEKTYTETITRAVGPTTLTGARGTLPEPAPDDANSIWVAPNGDDGDAGTEAAPKLTVRSAVAALNVGAGLANIQIFRNGYVGDLVIDVSSDSTGAILPIGATMQVEEGETVVIDDPTDSAGIGIRDETIFNGIDFGVPGEGGPVLETGTVGVVVVTMQNCRFGDLEASGAQLLGLAMEYSLFSGRITLPPANTLQLTLDNSIMLADPLQLADPVAERCLIFLVGSASNNDVTINATRSVISAFVLVRALITSAWAGTMNFNFDSCVLLLSGAMINGSQSTTGEGIPLNVTSDYSLNGVATYAESNPAAGDDEITFLESITITNPLDSSVPRLFTDESSATTDRDASGFRLQIKDKSTPDGTGQYFLTSPLRGAGSGGDDVAPWDETVPENEYAFTKEVDLDSPPASHSVAMEAVNPVEVDDIQGQIVTDFDELRRVWTLNWPTGDRYGGNNTWKQITDLLRDKGTKEVYLRGEDGNFLDELFGGTPSGTLDASSLTVDLAQPLHDLIPNNWRNWILEIDAGGSSTYQYWISGNDTETLFIEDRYGAGFPSDDLYAITIRKFLGMLRLSPLVLQQAYTHTGFLEGSKWAEDALGPAVTKDERLPPNGWTLNIVETADRRPA